MKLKYTKVALALSTALLVGCGSSSSDSSGEVTTPVVENLTVAEITELLTEAQLQELTEEGLTVEDLVKYTTTDDDTVEEIQAVIDEAIAAANAIYNSVLINDSSSGNTELTYENISTAASEGSLSVNVLLNSTEAKLSYITLEDPTSTNDSAVIDLKMATSYNTDNYSVTEGKIHIFIRTPDGAATDIDTEIEFPGDVWTNIKLTWNKTAETVEIVVSDFATGDEIDTYTATMNNTIDVASIRFKNGDSGSGGTTDTPYYIDDIVLTDASGTEIYANNFASTDLSDFTVAKVVVTDAENASSDVEAPVYVTELTTEQLAALADAGVEQSVIDAIIDGDMTEAQVQAAVDAAIAATIVADNLAAQVIDTLGSADSSTKDTGELRIKLSDEIADITGIETGQISATILIQEDADTTVVVGDDGKSSAGESIKDTGYISLYSIKGTSTNQLHGDIIFSSGSVKYRTITFNEDEATKDALPYLDDDGAATSERSEAEDVQVDTGIDYEEGKPIDVVITWDATGSKVSIDGGVTFSDNLVGQDLDDVNYVSFKIADTSAVSTSEFLIDDIVIEDDGTAVFEQDFEDFTAGLDLATEYSSSSSEASVIAADLTSE